MTDNPTGHTRVTISLPAADADLLQQVARLQGNTVSAFIADLVHDALDTVDQGELKKLQDRARALIRK